MANLEQSIYKKYKRWKLYLLNGKHKKKTFSYISYKGNKPKRDKQK